MNAVLYIIKTADMYRFGIPAEVRLAEVYGLSKAWMRKVTVSLPEGYSVKTTTSGEEFIFYKNEVYPCSLAVNAKEEPVIVNLDSGSHIVLPIIEEGW